MYKKILKNTKLLLCLIILIAGFLRFYQLGVVTPSLTWDEVAWGYNAYALSKDGSDEFGNFLPYKYLISFGDYKPPVYAYLTVLPVMLYGLTEFAVRFPSALFGTFTVLVTYFLVRELFGRESKYKYPLALALLSATFLAISPWHIMLSRTAFEANVATFLIVTGVWLFLHGIYKRPYVLIFAVISFILSMYTFNSARIVAPLLIFVLVLGHIKLLWKQKTAFVVSAIVGLALFLPIALFLVSPEAKLRYNEVNIFSDTKIIETTNQEVLNDNNAWWSKLIHNRRVAYSQEFLSHYFDHFNPSFLFISGDENPKFSTQDVGQLYLWDLPFLIVGIVFLFRKREKNYWILPVWLLIGIIPAAFARETPHALRIENTLPTWQILTAYGFIIFITDIRRFRIPALTVSILGLLFFVVYFLHGYYAHYTKEYPKEWQGGYKEVVQYIKENQHKYDRIYISNKMERAYIYTAFYLQYDPVQFRKEAKIRGNDFGFVHVDSFGKYHFVDEPEKIEPVNKRVLYIDDPENILSTAKVIKEFYLINGNKLFVAYTK